MKKEPIGKTKLFRKDPCPIDIQELISEAMRYTFWGWIIWLFASTLEEIGSIDI